MKLKKEAKAKADLDKENEEAGHPDILGEQEDQDVIFQIHPAWIACLPL